MKTDREAAHDAFDEIDRFIKEYASEWNESE